MLKKLQNENNVDRIVRFFIGIILAVLAFFAFNGTVQIILYVIAAVALFTSLTGFCLIYKILGISTKKKNI